MKLLSHWSGSGTANDDVGSFNLTWVNGTSYAPGNSGFLLSPSMYYLYNNDSTFSFLDSSDFAISLTITPNNITDLQAIITKGDYDYGWTYGIWIQDGEVIIKAYDSQNLPTIGANLQAGVTYDIYYTYSGGYQTVTINNVLQTLDVVSHPEPNQFFYGSEAPLYIGVYGLAVGSYDFDGIVKDIKVYGPPPPLDYVHSDILFSSTDLSSWSEVNITRNGNVVNTMEFASSSNKIVGISTFISPGIIYSSDDGISFVPVYETLSSCIDYNTNEFNSIIYDGTKFVVLEIVNQTGCTQQIESLRPLISTDGIVWTSGTIITPKFECWTYTDREYDWRLCFANNKYYVVSNNTDYYYVSSDLDSWTEIKLSNQPGCGDGYDYKSIIDIAQFNNINIAAIDREKGGE